MELEIVVLHVCKEKSDKDQKTRYSLCTENGSVIGENENMLEIVYLTARLSQEIETSIKHTPRVIFHPPFDITIDEYSGDHYFLNLSDKERAEFYALFKEDLEEFREEAHKEAIDEVLQDATRIADSRDRKTKRRDDI